MIDYGIPTVFSLDNQRKLEERVQFLENACAQMQLEIQTTLGKALGFPEHEGSVCVGEHIAETLAIAAAKHIEELNAN